MERGGRGGRSAEAGGAPRRCRAAMWGSEPPVRPGSPDCPDLLQHVQELRSPATPLYLSFFEEECRAIAARLRLGAAAEPSPGLGELSGLQPELAGPTTSTPLPVPSHGRVPDSSVGDGEAAAAPSPAPGEPGCLPQPAAGGGPGARPARPPAQARRVRRGAGQPSGGGPGTPARSPGRGRSRLSLPRARASLGLQLPAAGTGRGAWETRLLRPPGKRGRGGEPGTASALPALQNALSPPGTRLKLMSPARSRLQHARGAPQQAQPSSLPKPAPRDREMKNNSAPASCPTRSREARGLGCCMWKGEGEGLGLQPGWGQAVGSPWEWHRQGPRKYSYTPRDELTLSGLPPAWAGSLFASEPSSRAVLGSRDTGACSPWAGTLCEPRAA